MATTTTEAKRQKKAFRIPKRKWTACVKRLSADAAGWLGSVFPDSQGNWVGKLRPKTKALLRHFFQLSGN